MKFEVQCCAEHKYEQYQNGIQLTNFPLKFGEPCKIKNSFLVLFGSLNAGLLTSVNKACLAVRWIVLTDKWLD